MTRAAAVERNRALFFKHWQWRTKHTTLVTLARFTRPHSPDRPPVCASSGGTDSSLTRPAAARHPNPDCIRARHPAWKIHDSVIISAPDARDAVGGLDAEQQAGRVMMSPSPARGCADRWSIRLMSRVNLAECDECRMFVATASCLKEEGADCVRTAARESCFVNPR